MIFDKFFIKKSVIDPKKIKSKKEFVTKYSFYFSQKMTKIQHQKKIIAPWPLHNGNNNSGRKGHMKFTKKKIELIVHVKTLGEYS
jgi:hypothetical protein